VFWLACFVPRGMLEWFGMRGVRKTRQTAGRSHLSSSPFLLAFFPSLASTWMRMRKHLDVSLGAGGDISCCCMCRLRVEVSCRS
jgi:hypothetical protein